ncbi:MAG: Nramp family divalent metal transporter, partial [Candidatus Subteraquimicrobiales bacterium]|nr:Nramp family divalent metal transporter [Candidatus Subteraquimicrobiales bacterium]
LPAGIPLFTFLAALAYSGAGGNLNLAQSFYIKEKGYGMCKGTAGISSVLSGRSSTHSLEGKTFTLNDPNKSRFHAWWRVVNLEHLLVFLLTGAVTILLLALLSYATTRDIGLNVKDMNFMLIEAEHISTFLTPFFGGLFLFLTGLMLFGTQLTVLDSTSRIMAENVVIIERKTNLNSTYYIILWLQILAGLMIILSGFSNPIGLVVTGAVLNALAMFVHIAMTYSLNKRTLPKELQIRPWRKAIIFVSWIFFGVLSLWAIVDGVTKL